jgi:phosphatidylglycerophosphate synthase
MLLLATLCLAFVVYCALCVAGRSPVIEDVKHNLVFGPFFARFLVWLIGPLERLLIGRVSPNAITLSSLVLCAITGAAAALGHLPGAVWLYAFAGILDVLDGRLARLSNQQTPAGALFDSVSDRWGELFVFAGYVWFLHDSPWLLAVMGAIGGSMMVSYTRARAEGLGVGLAGGIMQRAERIVLVAGGTLIAAWCGGDLDTAALVEPIIGVTMLICGIASTGTAVHRWVVAYRELARRHESRTSPDAIGDAIGDAGSAITPPAVPTRVLIPSHVRKVAPLSSTERAVGRAEATVRS